MTIENTLERIAQSNERQERLLEQLIDRLTGDQSQLELPLKEESHNETTPVTHVTAASAGTPPTDAVVTQAPEPFPPVPVPTPAAVLPTCPVKDAKEMMEYCMGKYRGLGPVKGGMIQSILIEMGVSNINTIPVERYAEFYSKVEGIV